MSAGFAFKKCRKALARRRRSERVRGGDAETAHAAAEAVGQAAQQGANPAFDIARDGGERRGAGLRVAMAQRAAQF